MFFIQRGPGVSAWGPDRGLPRHAAVAAGPAEVQAGPDAEGGAAAGGVRHAPRQAGDPGGADHAAGLQDADHRDAPLQAQVRRGDAGRFFFLVFFFWCCLVCYFPKF